MQRKWQLQVISGLHQGAQLDLLEGSVLTLGSSVENDIVLSDDTVQPHHCVLSHNKGRLFVKPMAANIRHQNKEIQGFKSFSVVAGQGFEVADVKLQIVSQVTSRMFWFPKNRVMQLRQKPIKFGIVAFCLVSAVVVLSQSLQADSVLAVMGSSNPKAGLPGTELQADTFVTENTTNIVDRETSIQPGLLVEKDLAKEVGEILRLSQIEAQTKVLEPGVVEARGYFNNQALFQQVVSSRAIRDIDGLRKIVEVNLSDMSAPQKSQTQFYKLVVGRDSYLMGRDGSRFYPGAQLTNGYHLVSIDRINDDYSITIRSDGGELSQVPSGELMQLLNQS